MSLLTLTALTLGGLLAALAAAVVYAAWLLNERIRRSCAARRELARLRDVPRAAPIPPLRRSPAMPWLSPGLASALIESDDEIDQQRSNVYRRVIGRYR